MKFLLLNVGKTNSKNIDNAIIEYHKKIKYYINFDIKNLIIKNNNSQKYKIKKIESEAIKKFIEKNDYVILLDEKGESFTSFKFAKKLQNWMMMGKKRLVFVVGGPYGFSSNIYDRGNEILSLSQMTFSHQMVRLFFCEQLYRAFTIINNHPYHNN